jgi:DNA-binding transcriptional LysR family regulator
MKLDLRQLRQVLALDRYRSFARAADSVGISQPALSRSLQALEDEVGAKLFDRERAGVVPTAVGARLIELAHPLVAQARAIEVELRQMVGLAGGLLRIGAGPYAAEISVGTAVGRLARQHPGIRVEVVTQDWPNLLQALLNDEFDAVIAEMQHADADDRLDVEPLPPHEAQFFCRAGHPLAGRPKLTLQDLLAHTIVFGVLPRRVAEAMSPTSPADDDGLPMGATTMQLRVESLLVARRVVLESDVIGIAVPSQIARELADGRFAVLPLALPWMKTNYGIIRLAGRTPSPACVAFLDLLRGVEHELSATDAPACSPAIA